MSDKMIIDVQDISVPIARAINIAIINKPNPVSGFEATADQIGYLLNFPQYLIRNTSTGEIITGENYYEYFPDKDPHGGGGGGGGGGGSTGNGYTAGYAPKSKYGSAEVSPAGHRTNIESEG